MAYLKFVPNKYLTSNDVKALLNYCISPDRNPYYTSSIAHNSYNEIEYYTFNFCYPHFYHHKQGKTICYHYVLSFDLNNEISRLEKLSLDSLFCYLGTMPEVKGLNLFFSVHRTKYGLPKHIHILVSSTNPDSGKSAFINFECLKYQIGEILADFNIALAGYSYCTANGYINRGNYSPENLYLENFL